MTSGCCRVRRHRIARAHEGLGGADGRIVHHLQSGRDDSRGDHIAHRRACGFHRRKAEQQRLGRLDEARGERKGVPNWLSTHPDPLDRVVGFAQALGDGVLQSHMSFLAVHPDDSQFIVNGGTFDVVVASGL